MLSAVLLIHATMCVGDFGLLSYCTEQGKKEVVTFDDYQNAHTYFFIK